MTKIEYRNCSPVWSLDRAKMEILGGSWSKGHKLLGQWYKRNTDIEENLAHFNILHWNSSGELSSLNPESTQEKIVSIGWAYS